MNNPGLVSTAYKVSANRHNHVMPMPWLWALRLRLRFKCDVFNGSAYRKRRKVEVRDHSFITLPVSVRLSYSLVAVMLIICQLCLGLVLDLVRPSSNASFVFGSYQADDRHRCRSSMIDIDARH